MIKDLLIEYAAPLAVSLTLAVGGLAVTNTRDVAVLQTETTHIMTANSDLLNEMKDISKVIYRIEAHLEVRHNEG